MTDALKALGLKYRDGEIVSSKNVRAALERCITVRELRRTRKEIKASNAALNGFAEFLESDVMRADG